MTNTSKQQQPNRQQPESAEQQRQSQRREDEARSGKADMTEEQRKQNNPNQPR